VLVLVLEKRKLLTKNVRYTFEYENEYKDEYEDEKKNEDDEGGGQRNKAAHLSSVLRNLIRLRRNT
jgi:hypothetical protein